MKKFLGNFVLAVIIGAVPAYFGSAITGDIQYEGCIKGITYYNPKTSENGYRERYAEMLLNIKSIFLLGGYLLHSSHSL